MKTADKDSLKGSKEKLVDSVNSATNAGTGDKPGAGDGDNPGAGDGDKPGAGDGDKPGAGDGDKPGFDFEFPKNEMNQEQGSPFDFFDSDSANGDQDKGGFEMPDFDLSPISGAFSSLVVSICTAINPSVPVDYVALKADERKLFEDAVRKLAPSMMEWIARSPYGMLVLALGTITINRAMLLTVLMNEKQTEQNQGKSNATK